MCACVCVFKSTGAVSDFTPAIKHLNTLYGTHLTTRRSRVSSPPPSTAVKQSRTLNSYNILRLAPSVFATCATCRSVCSRATNSVRRFFRLCVCFVAVPPALKANNHTHTHARLLHHQSTRSGPVQTHTHERANARPTGRPINYEKCLSKNPSTNKNTPKSMAAAAASCKTQPQQRQRQRQQCWCVVRINCPWHETIIACKYMRSN